MARARREIGPIWPSWRYSPDGVGQIFQSELDVPEGWTEKPGQVYVGKPKPAVLDRTELTEQLVAKGIEPLGHWSAAYMKQLVDEQ